MVKVKKSSVQFVLSRLSPREKALLNYAFDRNMAAHVVYAKGKFIGVHLPYHQSRIVDEIAGYYTLGRLR